MKKVLLTGLRAALLFSSPSIGALHYGDHTSRLARGRCGEMRRLLEPHYQGVFGDHGAGAD